MTIACPITLVLVCPPGGACHKVVSPENQSPTSDHTAWAELRRWRIGIVGETPVAALADRPIGRRLGKGSAAAINDPAFRQLGRAGERIDRAPIEAAKMTPHRPIVAGKTNFSLLGGDEATAFIAPIGVLALLDPGCANQQPLSRYRRRGYPRRRAETARPHQHRRH
jgi:hypothetical protein